MKTFKAEKEILEEFFKNRKIKIKNKKSYPFMPFSSQEPNEEYRSVSYYGEIKNPQELNVKDSFDLIEYLKPCFVYVASDNKVQITELIDDWDGSENFYFEMGLFLINGQCPEFMHEPVGFNWFYRFKEELKVNQPLNGDKIKRYIENECRNKNNTFLFNDKPIQFEFIFKINRSYDYLMVLLNEWAANQYSTQRNVMIRRLFFDNNKKIINAEKTFEEDECVICLTNPPNILFCNCGHVCEECNKTRESLEKCPICKTENTNLRIIE